MSASCSMLAVWGNQCPVGSDSLKWKRRILGMLTFWEIQTNLDATFSHIQQRMSRPSYVEIQNIWRCNDKNNPAHSVWHKKSQNMSLLIDTGKQLRHWRKFKPDLLLSELMTFLVIREEYKLSWNFFESLRREHHWETQREGERVSKSFSKPEFTEHTISLHSVHNYFKLDSNGSFSHFIYVDPVAV